MNPALQAVEHRKQGRPRKWIARELSLPLLVINRIMNLVGNEIGFERFDISEYDRVEGFMRAGYTYRQVRNRSKWDDETILRFFPGLATPNRTPRYTVPVDAPRATDFANVLRQAEWRSAPYPVIADELNLPVPFTKEALILGGFRSECQAKMSLGEYRALEAMIDDGCSLGEIHRTTGRPIKTVRRWFPEAGWPQGGSAESAMVRRSQEVLDRAGGLYA